MKSSQRVDVIIPVYNGALYIQSVLDSVLQQTYAPKRIIAINDGSTDATAQIIDSYTQTHQDSEIKIIQIQKENGGLSSARNEGIRYSLSTLYIQDNQTESVDYIAFLDVDDIWHPEKLKKQLEQFEKNEFLYQNKKVGVVYCAYNLIDESGVSIEKNSKTKKLFVEPELKGNVFEKLLTANKISGSGSAVLIKREYLAQVGLFDETLKACEDWDMWLRLAQICEFDFVDEQLVLIRRHNQSMQANISHMFKNELTFYKKWILILKRIPASWVLRILRRVWQICVQ